MLCEMKNIESKKGYAVLGTVISVSFIMILIGVSIARSSSEFGKNVLTMSVSAEADAMLLSCISIAREKVAESRISFSGEIWKLKNGTCTIVILSETDLEMEVRINATVAEANTAGQNGAVFIQRKTTAVVEKSTGELMELLRE